MPTYEYACPSGHQFDVIKHMSELDRPETCECGQVAERRMPSRFGFTGAADWNRQEQNPGLGCVTKGWRHAEKIAKERGMIPVGNEKPETIHKHFDTMREERRQQRYKDAADLK